jgi:prolyl oligopeptidase
MRPFTRFLLLTVLSVPMTVLAATDPDRPAPAYPPTPRVDVRMDRFGLRADDPYRWLENDVRVDSAVRDWVDAQNAVTRGVLDALPGRDALAQSLTRVWNFARYSVPVRRGERLFYRRNSGLQNQSVLVVQEARGVEPRVLIDPNPWAADGATALAEWSPSVDGTHLAYAIQDGGTDWRSVRVLEVATGRTLGDELRWVKFSGLEWAADGSGFYYSRFPAPTEGAEFQSLNLNQAVYFHRLGEPQSADRLVYATPEAPKRSHGATLTPDGRWLVLTTSEGTDDRYEVAVQDLAAHTPPRVLFPGLDYSWSLVGSEGDRLYFKTNRNAPRYRVVSIDAAAANAPLVEVVPEGAGTLEEASIVAERLVVTALEDAKSVVHTYALDGTDAKPLPLPGLGSVAGFESDPRHSDTYYGYTSFTTPETIYHVDLATGVSEVYQQPELPFDPSSYTVRQDFYASKDGTRVPLFIVARRDLPPGPHPTVLYGYGGFNISLTPSYSASRQAWLDAGGVWVVANLRGGGEYGKAWHDGGRLLNKQNVFDDCIAAAEYLIHSGVTTSRQLALLGGSNGGLLVGAVVNQRPDLFAAASPAVGVMDMLRYPQFTAGRYWVDDYGSPDDPTHFRNLLSYSPYHNVRAGQTYPAILVTTADTDDRVVPGHSFKYAARLQSLDLGPKPHLIRIETRAGHGSGKPTDKLIAEYTDLWAFFGYYTGLLREATP